VDLDALMRICIDAAAAFAVVNLVNSFRRGWLWPGVKTWLERPTDKVRRQSRTIALAWWVSVVVSAAFALRAGAWDWKALLGEWLSRALITWLLAMGQFDVIKLAWPRAFGPGQTTREEADRSDETENMVV